MTGVYYLAHQYAANDIHHVLEVFWRKRN